MSFRKQQTPKFLSSVCRYSAAKNTIQQGVNLGGFSSGTWPSASLALYCPLEIPFRYKVQRLWVVNGTAAGSIDIGIYSQDWTKIYSTGATAQAGTSAPQYITPSTPFILDVGSYYLGLMLTSTSGTTFRSTAATAQDLRMAGWLQEATGGTLPTAMTPAAVANAYYPLFGITKKASGF